MRKRQLATLLMGLACGQIPAAAAIYATPSNCIIESGSSACAVQLNWNVVAGHDIYLVPISNPAATPVPVFSGHAGHGLVPWVNESGHTFQLRIGPTGPVNSEYHVYGIPRSSVSITAVPAGCAPLPGQSTCTVRLSWPASSSYDLYAMYPGQSGTGFAIAAGQPAPGSLLRTAEIDIPWITQQGSRFELRSAGGEVFAHSTVYATSSSGSISASPPNCSLPHWDTDCEVTLNWAPASAAHRVVLTRLNESTGQPMPCNAAGDTSCQVYVGTSGSGVIPWIADGVIHQFGLKDQAGNVIAQTEVRANNLPVVGFGTFPRNCVLQNGACGIALRWDASAAYHLWDDSTNQQIANGASGMHNISLSQPGSRQFSLRALTYIGATGQNELRTVAVVEVSALSPQPPAQVNLASTIFGDYSGGCDEVDAGECFQNIQQLTACFGVLPANGNWTTTGGQSYTTQAGQFGSKRIIHENAEEKSISRYRVSDGAIWVHEEYTPKVKPGTNQVAGGRQVYPGSDYYYPSGPPARIKYLDAIMDSAQGTSSGNSSYTTCFVTPAMPQVGNRKQCGNVDWPPRAGTSVCGYVVPGSSTCPAATVGVLSDLITANTVQAWVETANSGRHLLMREEIYVAGPNAHFSRRFAYDIAARKILAEQHYGENGQQGNSLVYCDDPATCSCANPSPDVLEALSRFPVCNVTGSGSCQ